MLFKNSKLYDTLKYLALVALDAIGIAYEELAEVWNLPFGDEVMKTCAVISVLIGTLIGVSSYKYKKMPVDTDTTEEDELLTEREE